MRPRWKVLLYCADPTTAGIMAFALRNRQQFRVFVANSMEFLQELIGAGQEGYFAGMVAVLGEGSDTALLACEEAQRAGIRTVLLKRAIGGAAGDTAIADVVLPGHASPAEWIEALRIVAVRKRGPKALRTRVAPVSESVERAA